MSQVDFQIAKHKPVLLTVEQIAQMIQVSTRTIWRMRSAEQLPSPVRVSGGVRWRLQDITQWIEAGCPSQPASVNNQISN